MSRPGSHDHARAVAAAAAVDAGLTRLGIALVAHVAGRGVNFQTDEQIRNEITKPDGRRYHRESIGRMRRQVTRAGILSGKRFRPGQRPPGAKFRTSHGVVVTAVVWPALRRSTPTLRGARAAARAEARRARNAPMSAQETEQAATNVLRVMFGDDGPDRPPK